MARKVYLDMCCLKRPFDEQSQPRVAVETAAVLAILHAIETGQLEAIRSPAHDLENADDPDSRRRAVVHKWLVDMGPAGRISQTVVRRVEELVSGGLKKMDAYHLALAEDRGADVLVTTDTAFLSKCRAWGGIIEVQVLNPTDLAREMTP